MIHEMILAQGLIIGEYNELTLPDGTAAAMSIPSDLLPGCPDCGRPLTMNLRSDDRFVEDEGWQRAAMEYEAWQTAHRDQRVVFLEIGVGYNMPGIIKYNFWQQVYQNENAVYACLNMEPLQVPEEVRDRSIVISGNSAQVIQELVSCSSMPACARIFRLSMPIGSSTGVTAGSSSLMWKIMIPLLMESHNQRGRASLTSMGSQV